MRENEGFFGEFLHFYRFGREFDENLRPGQRNLHEMRCPGLDFH